jgi:predicted ATPase
MISRLEALHYRCFDQLAIEMDAYHVLAGANGSGKSTLLDIPMLLGDMLSKGLLPALLETSSPTASARAQSLQELIHCHRGNYFSFAMEATLPESTVMTLVERVPTSVQKDQKKWPHRLRYEMSFEVFNYTELHVTDEFLYIVPQHTTRPAMGWSINGHRPRTWKTILARTSGAPVVMHAEYHRDRFVLRLRPQQLALANLPYDFHLFPASGWFKELLEEGVMRYAPNGHALRQASPPGQPKTIRPDAGNLPWMVLNLKHERYELFEAWVEHVKMALPYLVAIDAVEREEDHHAYLKLTYQGGYTVTSSGLSDGTLRILALTILPYLSRAPRIICVEEPEDSIHPRAIELVLQSLTSLYDSQVWVATHSPMVLAHTDLKAVIVMRGSVEGNAVAIAGAEHPQLRDWQGGIDLGSLFAAGVLG